MSHPRARIEHLRDADLDAVAAITSHYILRTHAHFADEAVTPADVRANWLATRAMFPWLVAREGDEVIGFARAAPWKSRCAYAWAAEVTAYLRPGATGRGLGRALYDRLLPILRAQGYRTLIAGIALPNPASVRLHEAIGMRPAGVFERVGFKQAAWRDVGYWQMALGDPASPPAAVRPVADVEPGAV